MVITMKTSIISDQINMDFEKALHTAKEYFSYVEIHSLWGKTIEDISDSEAAEMEKLLEKNNMRVSCLSTTLFLMCPLYTEVKTLEPFSDKFLVFSGTRNEHIEKLKRCTELAVRFKADSIRVFPFRKETGIREDMKVILRDMAEIFREASIIAEKKNKVLAVENCPFTYLPRGNMTFELADLVNQPGFSLLYDIGNSYRCGMLDFPEEYKKESLQDEFSRIIQKISHFHFKDYTMKDGKYLHLPLGEGDINYKEFYSYIKKESREWCVSLEPEVDEAGTIKSIENFLRM